MAPDVRFSSHVVFDAADLVDGAVIAIDGHDAEGFAMRRAEGTGDRLQFAAYLAGTLTFEAASDESCAPLVGVLDATLFAFE